MMTIPRSALRAIRSVARKCVIGRPRGPAPPITLFPDQRSVRAGVAIGDVMLQCDIPTDSPGKEAMTVSLADLAPVEGTSDDPVSLERVDAQQVRLSWHERGVPRSQTIPVVAGSARQLPTLPTKFRSQSSTFLAAMHEAGRTTCRDAARYALHCVQLQGRHGTVVATDGKQAYVHDGFTFPFADDVLIPAVPVFVSRELAASEFVELGRTDSHLVVKTGPWTVFLLIDPHGRFPDVRGIIPRTPTPTTLVLDEVDAMRLIDELPVLPGANDDCQPVTLDLEPGEPGVVRAQGSQSETPVELRLSSSFVTNGPSRVALNRTWLQRAMTLGCRTVKVVGVAKPIVATGGSITLVTLGLDASCIVAHSSSSIALPSPIPPRRSPMKPPDTNGSLPSRVDPPDGLDPLAEAEALKSALTEAAFRAGRLVQLLKQNRKEKRVLQSAWTALKSLNLGANGGAP